MKLNQPHELVWVSKRKPAVPHTCHSPLVALSRQLDRWYPMPLSAEEHGACSSHVQHRQEERKKKDEGIKMVMEATRKPDPGPADEQAAGDDEAEARGAEEKDAIAAEAAGARKPSKYRRARKDI